MTHTINTPLLRKALEHITLNSLEWDQGTWFRYCDVSPCKTAGCLAGHVAVLSGVPLHYEQLYGVAVPALSQHGHLLETVAKEELGLSFTQSFDLFSAANSLRDLWALAERYTECDIQASDMDMLLGDSQ